MSKVNIIENSYLFCWGFTLFLKIYAKKCNNTIFWKKMISLSKSFLKTQEFFDLIFSQIFFSGGVHFPRIIAFAVFNLRSFQVNQRFWCPRCLDRSRFESLWPDFGPKSLRLVANGTNPGILSDQIQYLLAWWA